MGGARALVLLTDLMKPDRSINPNDLVLEDGKISLG